MQNIFNQLDANAPSHMNAFDLSQRHIFSNKVGLKVPVACFETMPKDYFEFDVLSLVRSMPINTAAYARMKVQFDAVFVPYQQLWHGWNQFILQTEENMSTGTSYDTSLIPRLDLSDMLRYCIAPLIFFNKLKDIHFVNCSESQIFTYVTGEEDAYRYAFDDMGFLTSDNMLRALDLFGYGAYYACAQAMERFFTDHYTMPKGGLNATADAVMQSIASLNDAWESWVNSSQILLNNPYPELLCLWLDNDTNSGPSHRIVNLFRPLAYQKAWQDFTMNKRLQRYDPSFFNVDAHGSFAYGSPHFMLNCMKFFTLRYEAWPYDMFTGLFPSPQSGDVSLVDGSANLFLVSNDGSNFSSSTNIQARFKTTTASPRVPLVADVANTHTNISGPSVYDIKRAEFLQRWKENHLRAGNKLKSQALGQWNTQFRYMSDEYADFITSWEMPVNIDEVINTADKQGEISGKGIGTSDGHFKYTASDHGVIIILCTIVPRPEYDAVMIDRQNTCIEPFDYPTPFFDNLGFEGVPFYLLNNSTFGTYGAVRPKPTYILGYAPRYLSWKTAIDKVHGEFMSFGAPSAHTGGSTGQFSIWTAPRRDLEDIAKQSIDLTQLCYISPNIVDTLFASEATSKQETDHFLFNTNFIVKVVRNLSVSGQLGWGV